MKKTDFYNNKEKIKLKFWQITLIKAGIYAVVGVILSVSILSYLNNVYFLEASTTEAKVVTTSIKGIPEKTECLSFTYDKSYYMYLKDGVIYIKDVKTNKLKTEIKEDIPISYAFLVEDRNLITYFTVEKGKTSSVKKASSSSSAVSSRIINEEDEDNDQSSFSSSSSYSSSKSSVPDITYVNPYVAKIRTYDIDKDKKTFHKSFDVKTGSKIKDVQFSRLTNLIFVNFESVSGGKTENNIFKIDVVSYVELFTTGKIVDKMVVLNKTKTYVYQTNTGAIYSNYSLVQPFKDKKLKLIGCDEHDNIYAQSHDNPADILVLKSSDVKNSKATPQVITLKDSRVRSFHFNRFGVYAIYNDYVINLSGNLEKKAMMNNNASFLDTVGNRIYLKNPTGEIFYIISDI